MCRHYYTITYDENKAKADIPTQSLNNIQVTNKTTAAYKKSMFVLDLVNQKSSSNIIRTH